MSTKSSQAASAAFCINEGWIPEPFINTERKYFTPPEGVKEALTPLLQDCSIGELRRKYPVLDCYFQMASYDALFTEIFEAAHVSILANPEEFENTQLHKYESLANTQDWIQHACSQLDILGTIDHLPTTPFKDYEPDDKIRTVVQAWRKFTRDYPQKHFRDNFDFHKQKAKIDDASNLLRRMSLQTRRSYMVQRVLNAILTAAREGWFIVFDTLTLANDRLETFYQNPNALRDHHRNIGRLVLTAEHRSQKENFNDCFQYFCVPEFGGETGRLHFHSVYLMRTLPRGCVDPNYGTMARGNRIISKMQGLWPYGHTLPIAVRYAGDAYGHKLNWLWPVDKKGKPIQSKPAIAIAYYVTKYVNKNTDQNFTRLGIGATPWNKTLMEQLNKLPKTLFRVRMSRGFGSKLPSMDHLSLSSLRELTKLHTTVSPLPALLKRQARKLLRSRLGALSLADIMAFKPKPTNLLKSLRASMDTISMFNPQSFIDSLTPKLTLMDVSNETLNWLKQSRMLRPNFRSPGFTGGRK